ncbi:MAG TPA: hypothetical protein QGI39_00945 [Gammaproteobacteria bacterium]|jgi:hypothetical protein|nr:hypothetical protein [Gammaproteobacteria bacterium]
MGQIKWCIISKDRSSIAHGTMHLGRAVTVEGDATFDNVEHRIPDSSGDCRC